MLTAISTPALLKELGSRIQQERLNQNISQTDLAVKAGVARGAIQKLEREGRSTLATFVNILRALGKLEQFRMILPEPGPSPLQLVRLQGRERRRASHPRNSSGSLPLSPNRVS